MKNRKNKTLMTDYYELTMGQTYYDLGMKDTIAYFDVFFRKIPLGGGYLASGGLEETIDYIKNFRFTNKDIEYLRSRNQFSEEFLKYLKGLKFKGDIWAVPDGTMVFPDEPVLTVKADIITAQILETALLVNFNAHSLVITKAKRITNEAKGRPVMEFGARRARGFDAAIEASKDAIIGGCSGTSNTLAAMEYGITPLGTMAHSLVQFVGDEYEAFLAFAKSNPNNCVFLVDTYDVLRSGIPNAIRVADEYLTPNGLEFKGIRIDSGDLDYLSKEARKMLDAAGYPNAKICISNSLDEYAMKSLNEQGTPYDQTGNGERLISANDRVCAVYKLVAVEEDGIPVPRIKVSEDTGKTINPGYKKPIRFYDNETGYAIADVIKLYNEILPTEKYTLVHPTETWKTKEIKNYRMRELLVPIFKKGKLVYKLPTVEESRDYCQREFETLYPETRRLKNPNKHIVDLTDELRKLKEELIRLHTKKVDPPKQFRKGINECEKKN